MKNIISILLLSLFCFQNCAKQENKMVPYIEDIPESIKPDLITSGHLDYKFPKGMDITYIATADIDSSGIPTNISLDKRINSLYDSLAIKYTKSFRFKPISEYPEKSRVYIQKRFRITIQFKNNE